MSRRWGLAQMRRTREAWAAALADGPPMRAARKRFERRMDAIAARMRKRGRL